MNSLKTEVLTNEIERAVKILGADGLVAVPTETVYGLAGNGLKPEVIERIYEVKGRPGIKPISLMVPDAESIANYCVEVPKAAAVLAQRFWPGPLTLVLKAKPEIPMILRAGGATVGLRCPQQMQTLELLRRLDFPLAVPSANPSGEKSPTTAKQVMAYFDGEIEAVLDGGPCALGRESTLIDLSAAPYRILREGALCRDTIADALADAIQLVGITGGSGSGKTCALQRLEAHGALLIDADRVYHELLESDPELNRELIVSFPAAAEGEKIERRRLADVVFRDAAALEQLNEISHRYVRQEIRRRLREHAMRGGRLAAIDAIGLFGSGTDGLHLDFSIAVTAPEDLRIQRIMERDGLSREAAVLRIRAQHPDSWFRERCDYTVSNDGSLAEFENNIDRILEDRIWKT